MLNVKKYLSPKMKIRDVASILIVATFVIIVVLYIIVFFEGLEAQKYATPYDTVRLAHRCDDGYIYYHNIQLPEGISMTDLHNFKYVFINVMGKPEDIIPKYNITTGEAHYISQESAEYKLVWKIRYNQIKEAFKEKFNPNTLRSHDVFIRTSH